jgi:eukaryotic-like serine/threonine-protein kinase
MPIERTAASSPRDGEPRRPLSMVIPPTDPLPRGAWETLFDQLAESNHEIRAAKLLQIAEQDPALARRLADMLEADARSGSALDVPLGERAPGFVAAALEQAAVAEPARDRAGQLVGAYRLLRLLGRGGMGEVYLAERADGEYEQRVAIKLIQTGLGSEKIHERFLRERQILAQLDHPGIARLLDGGRGEDGAPYFVLEFVDGLAITEYCAARHHHRGLGIEARMRLLISVCEAVDLAHQKLVVHRDLKPSNILVTGDGRVKLLDFGIAKLIAREPGEAETQLEAAAFTRAYAAPEQILGQPVTTATDVFALGVLMYELLTGAKPFSRSAVSPSALAREVESETFEPPSAAVPLDAAAGESRRDRKRRARQLEGDLDTIVHKALAPEPGRRYMGAAALATDLRRYLERLPILARPDSLRYRTGRFVARHRFAVASAVLVTVSLVGGLALALWQADVARRQTRRAEHVRDFLIDLFRQADPSHTRGTTITAREILEAGARQVAHDLGSDPPVEAELLDTIAQVEGSLALPAARAHAEQALAISRRSLGEDDPGTTASRLTQAEVLLEQGDLETVRLELDGIANRAREPLLARRYDAALIEWLRQSGKTTEALAHTRTRLDREVAAHGEGSLEAARTRLSIAALLSDSSRVTEAVPLARAAVAVIARAPGASGVEIAAAERQLADMLETVGDREAALGRFASALAHEREVLGPTHPEVAFTEIPYGFALSESHRYEQAERILTDAVAILRPIDHYEQGSALRYLGFTLQARNRWEEAERRYAEAEAIFVAKLGEEHQLTLAARLSRAWALAQLGRLPDAEQRLRAVAAAIERTDGPRSNPLRTALKYLGEVRRRRGDPIEALALHRRARAIESEIFGTTHHRAIAASDLQIVLDLLARPSAAGLAEARRFADEGIEVFRATDPDEQRLSELLVASGRIALGLNDFARAQRDLTEADHRMTAERGPAHPEIAEVRQLLARAQRATAPN